MYDNIKLFIFYFTNKEFEDLKVLLSIENTNIDSHQSESFDLENLRFNYYPNRQKLRIRNSIHKFYNAHIKSGSRTNSTVFKFEQFMEVVDFLCNILNRKSSEIIVGGDFEFGVNLYLPKNFNIMNIITRYEYFKSTTFNPFSIDKPYRGKPYQVSCALSDYRIKYYDKTKQENITNYPYNIYRMEVVIGNIRKLREILLLQNPNKVTLEDLLEFENWCALANYLSEVYENTVKKPLLKGCNNVNELALIHTLLDYQFYLDVKELFPNKVRTFRKKSEEFRLIYEYNDNNLHFIISKHLDAALYNILSI